MYSFEPLGKSSAILCHNRVRAGRNGGIVFGKVMPLMRRCFLAVLFSLPGLNSIIFARSNGLPIVWRKAHKYIIDGATEALKGKREVAESRVKKLEMPAELKYFWTR